MECWSTIPPAVDIKTPEFTRYARCRQILFLSFSGAIERAE